MNVTVSFKPDPLYDPGLCAPGTMPVPAQKRAAAREQGLGAGQMALRCSTTFGWFMVFLKLRFAGM